MSVFINAPRLGKIANGQTTVQDFFCRQIKIKPITDDISIFFTIFASMNKRMWHFAHREEW